MKMVGKYFILLILLFLNTSCKKQGIVEPLITLPQITNYAPVILSTSSIVLSGKIDLHGSGPASIYFEYGLTKSYGLKTPVQKITSSGAYSARVINLNPETLYHWRIYCKTTDIFTGHDTTFVTLLQPIVNNLAVTNLTYTGTTLTGQIDLQGRDSVSVYFEYGLTTSYGSRTPEQFIATSGNFNTTIDNLKPETNYHWRINCKPNNGNSDLTTIDSTFTTLFLPSFTSLSISNLTITSVNLIALIDLHGRSNASFHFEYGLTTSYGSKSPEQIINSSGNYNLALNNLKQNTTYHWRIYLKTSEGDIISDDDAFSTFFLPTITNLLTNNITNTTVNFSGFIDLHGRSSASVYIEYGLTSTYGTKSTELNISSSGTFNIAINDLIPGSTYHARIYCKTTDGDITGADLIFSKLIEFIYPLNIGQTWTYNYILYIVSYPGPNINTTQKGVHIWQVMSKNVVGDSIIYNLICTTHDSIFYPPSFEEKSIPFTIVVTQTAINVNFGQTVTYPTPILPIPRFVTAGTIQVQIGKSLYINGTGLINYKNGFFSQSVGYFEQLDIIQ